MANFEEFIKSKRVTKNSDFTHTSFKGGKYYIQSDEYEEYLKLYQEENGSSFGIVEFPKSIRYMRFDLDLHFSNNRHYKKYTIENIYQIVKTLRTEIAHYLPVNKKFTIYVLQRPQETEKGDIIKNGIHIQIPEITTKMDYLSKFIRDKLICNENIIKVLKEMEVVNPINDVFDECIYTKNGWMQYGSDKGTDNSNAYKIKYYQKDDKLNHIASLVTSTKNDNVNYTELFALRNKHKPIVLNDDAEKLVEKLSQEDNEKERQIIIATEKKKEMIEEAKSNRKYDDVVDKDFIKELVCILNPNRVDDYQSWSELGWCLKSIDEGLFELFDKLSQGSGKYDESAVDKFWNNATKGNYTMGTLRFWAKQDNLEKYNEVCDKYRKWDMKNTLPQWDDDSIAQDFAKRYSDKFIFQDEVMYYFNGVYWEVDTKNRNIKAFICNRYRKDLDDININIRNERQNKCNNDDDLGEIAEKYKKGCDSINKHLKKSASKKDIVDCLELYLMNTDVKFDTKPYIFCFKNKVWDLTKGTFIEPNALDYLTITTGYKYDEDKQLPEKLENIDKLISTIFPIKEEKEYFCRILATSMCGIQVEKLFIFNGKGRNGKGVIDELLMNMLGDYGLDGNISVITDEKKGGSNVEFAELANKRLVVFKEPPENKGMNMASVKEITGSGKINARSIYKEKTKTHLTHSTFLECNQRLNINSKIQNADVDRIVDILFRSTFASNQKLEYMKNQLGELPEYHFKGDKYYKTDEFKDEYIIPLFHYLQQYFKQVYDNNDWELDIGKPQSIIERTNDYLQSNDLLYSWFKDVEENGTTIENTYANTKKSLKYTKGNKFDTIPIRDLLKDFKESDIFENLTKLEKRKYTTKAFTEEIITNEYLKVFFKKRYRYTNEDGKKFDINNCIIGFVRLEEDIQNFGESDKVYDTDDA